MAWIQCLAQELPHATGVAITFFENLKILKRIENPTRNHEVVGSIPGPAQWVKHPSVAMSCGIGCRHGQDLALLWLWYRPAALAPIRRLDWEPPYAVGMALKKRKKNK